MRAGTFELMSAKHWILLAVIALSLTFATKFVTSYVKTKMGWSDDPVEELGKAESSTNADSVKREIINPRTL
jgi:hypothetical protein